VGDFHGEVPDTLRRKLLSINVDACLCVGDLCKAAERRQFFISHFHELRQGRPPEDIFRLIPAKTHISDMESMQVVIDFLGELQVPVFLVPGNVDYLAEIANVLGHEIDKLVLENRISTIENLHLVEKEAIDFLGHQILGYSGLRMRTSKTSSQVEELCKKELEELSLKVVNWRRVIFLAHWPPYKTLDHVDNPSSPFYGEHLGLEFFLHFIRKHQPLVFACGHVHEQQGKAVIGETLVINPGCAQHGQAAILTLSGNKITDLNFIR
jgi:Icc-related predicted phosphoesterase